jgi:hypothetical protein
MTYCANCSSPLDECNESQPVCPRCGSFIASEFDAELELADEALSESLDSNEDAARYKDWPQGIRLRAEFRTVCLQCSSNATGTSFLTCGNTRCGSIWRVSRCRACKQPVDSRDPETPRCAKCGWLICARCLACNCPS